jgi:hypothetical protein
MLHYFFPKNVGDLAVATYLCTFYARAPSCLNDSISVHFYSARNGLLSELRCPRHWDHLLCWPETNPGVNF